MRLVVADSDIFKLYTFKNIKYIIKMYKVFNEIEVLNIHSWVNTCHFNQRSPALFSNFTEARPSLVAIKAKIFYATDE